jgi:Zn-dependent M28 family amino/carboxypeptidase
MFLAKHTLLLTCLAAAASAADFSGSSALKFTAEAVAFGPRPSGSAANLKLQAYILSQLKTCACEVSEDAFTAKTPKGAIQMKNILAKFPGKSGRAIVITGHFDTKLFPGRKFVGANDGGSSTGVLLEMARALAHQPRTDDVYLVWFDGEEAVREEWEGDDNLYGSRHLAERWRKDGTLARVKALINVDMVGEKGARLQQDPYSDAGLRRLIWSTAAELGYKAYFPDTLFNGGVDDDHMMFVKLGVPSVDLIHFDDYWHKDTDTMDKLSAQSLESVGTVVLEVIHRLEQK